MNAVLESGLINGLFNPYKFTENINFKGGDFVIRYTKRAQKNYDNGRQNLLLKCKSIFHA